MNRVLNRIVLFLFFLVTTISSQHQGPIPPIPSGYGADGSLNLKTDSIPSKSWRRKKIYLYYPEPKEELIPVIFFLKAMGVDDKGVYEHILSHIATRGYCAVMPDYKLASFPHQRRTYKKLLAELLHAVSKLSPLIDTSRVGFVGHSFGGAAIPALTWQCITNNKWGSNGAFMFIMAPHFVFEITQSQLEQFPKQVKMVMQVYEEDDCNDHRIAEDIFRTINIPASEKDFMILLSDSNATTGYTLTADHAAPFSQLDSEGEVDGMDYYGIYRIFDALAEYTFTQNREAKEIALGNGSKKQRFMGIWPDSSAVREPLISDDPKTLHPCKQYYFHWKHPWNPRRKISKAISE